MFPFEHYDLLYEVRDRLNEYNSKNPILCLQRDAVVDLIGKVQDNYHGHLTISPEAEDRLELTLVRLTELITNFTIIDYGHWWCMIKRKVHRKRFDQQIKQQLEALALQLLLTLAFNAYEEEALTFLRKRSKDIFDVATAVITIVIFGTMFGMEGFEGVVGVEASPRLNYSFSGDLTPVANCLFSAPASLVVLFPKYLVPYLLIV